MPPVDPVALSASPMEAPGGDKPAFVARQFLPQDLDQVTTIFVEGMRDYPAQRDTPLLAEYIEESLATDLSDIEGTYIGSGGNFWVVTPATDHATVVGMVGLEAKPNNEGELRRMSVRLSHHRFGLGKLLLATVEQWAAAHGYTKIWLTTGGEMKKAIAFYNRSGYTQDPEVIHTRLFPIVVKFEKLLQPVTSSVAYHSRV